MVNDESFFIEKRYKRKDGSDIWINIHAALVRNAQGVITGCAAVTIDITARKRAKEQRAQPTNEPRQPREPKMSSCRSFHTSYALRWFRFSAMRRCWMFRSRTLR